MHRVFLLISRTLLFAACAFSGVALAQDKPKVIRMAVLPAIIEGASGSATTQELFEQVSPHADFRVGLELVSYNALFIDGVEPIAKSVRGCGSDQACVSKVLKLANIQLGLQVIANFAAEPALITLNLLDTDAAKVSIDALEELKGGMDLKGVLRLQVARLLDSAGYQRGGRLAVSRRPPDAVVTVGEGEPADAGRPDLFTLKPGPYEVTAQREGFVTQKKTVTIREKALTEWGFELQAVPEESSFFASPWFWAIVGAAVVGGTTAALVATDPFSKPADRGCLCITTESGGCPVCL